MTKKITIQHLYTTGTNAAPAASALTLGEIAISAGEGREGIYFKNSGNDIVKVPTSTEIEKTISNLDGNGLTYSALVGRDPKFHVGAGTGITVTVDAVSIDTDYQNKISSGVTAYNWGNHATIGYAKDTDLTTLRNSVSTHTGDTTLHITSEERDDWNKAKSDIDAFLYDNNISGAVDTLKEIQEFLTSDDGTVQTLLDNLSALTETVNNNTTAITQNSSNISKLNTSASTITNNITNINDKIGSGFTSDNTIRKEIESIKDNQSNFVTNITGSGNISAATISNVGKQYTITHTTAGTQASAITATNGETELSFSSEFKIVDNIGYDANGHVVSGSTQTLKLPSLPAASELKAGVSMIKGGDLSLVTNMVNGQAAASYHFHNQYVKFTDLSNNPNSESIIISCGTY